MTKIITKEQYGQLARDEADWYYQVFDSYTKKRVRDYSECDCCGHRRFLGYKTIEIPVGEPKYKKMTSKEFSDNSLARYYAKQFLERAESTIDSSVLQPYLGKTGKMIVFSEYAPLKSKVETIDHKNRRGDAQSNDTAN